MSMKWALIVCWMGGGVAFAAGEPSSGSLQSERYAASAKAIVQKHLQPGVTLEPKAWVEVALTSRADGQVQKLKVVGTSGHKLFEMAIASAVLRAEYLPRDEGGTAPSTVRLRFVASEITGSQKRGD